MQNPVLKLGSKGPRVVELQSLLRVASDGVFGPKTYEAVRLLQASNDLRVDGIVGPATWGVLLSCAACEQRGVDLSSYTPRQNWRLLRSEGASFGIVRASFGTTFDDLALAHLLDARIAGFDQLGVYGYVRGDLFGEEQAKRLLERAAQIEASLGIKLAVFLDGEDRAKGDPWPRASYAQTLLECFRELRRTRKAGSYLGPWYASQLREAADISELGEGPLWISDYTPPVDLPKEWSEWSIWQTRGGVIDWNVFEGDPKKWEETFLSDL